MGEIKAIETVYNGYRFRSRLEARWAVFFDVLGVNYEYEPEGFILPSGKRYLPDFRVKCWGTRGLIQEKPFDLWVEVKGRMTQEDAEKIKEFAIDRIIYETYKGEPYETATVIRNPVLIVGDIPRAGKTSCGVDIGSYDYMDGINIYPFNLELVDGDYFGTGFQFEKGKLLLGGDDSSYGGTTNAIVDRAYDIARQARFEHGETPQLVDLPFC